VKKIAEKFNHLSRVHQRYRETTDDRQTDTQTTDGIATASSEREREFTSANKIQDNGGGHFEKSKNRYISTAA